jgi:tape measure domain-containing protein
MSNVREVGVRFKVGATGLEEATKLSRSLKDLGTDAQELDKRAGELAAELTKLGQQQLLIDAFKRKKQATEEAARALTEAQAAAQKLGREFAAAEEPTKRQEQALARARAEVTKAKQAYQESGLALQTARKGLSDAGIGTDQLAAAQVRVRQQTEQAKQAVAELTTRYRDAEGAARLNAQQQAQLAKATADAGASSTRAAAQQVAAGQQVAGSLEGVQRQLTDIGRLAVGGVLGAGGLNFLQNVTATADAFNNLRARMQLVTGEGPPLTQALQAVQEIAQRTGASLENTGTLFGRVLSAGREMGLAQADALRLTESINQAVAISGTSAAASDAAITQLIQGLQSGVLRGEEFNSVVEQAPRLAQALADGLGVTRGQLRGLAQDGQISSEAVIKAIESQRAVLQREFEQLPQTVGRAIENLSTNWKVFIGNLDQTTGFTDKVASGINLIAENLDELAGIAGRAGVVIVAALAINAAGALRDLGAEALKTAGSFGGLLTSIEKIPKAVNIAIAVTGFEVGFQIGEKLRENSEYARKLGVAVTEFFVNIVRDLQFVKEAAAAIFTDDTVTAAFDRLKQRAQEQEQIFGQLYKDAEQAPSAVRAAAAAAEAELKKTGDTAQTAGSTIAGAGVAGAAGIARVAVESDTAAGAIASLIKSATGALPAVGQSARQQAEQMAKLAQSSEAAAKRIAEGIPAAVEKLNGTQLKEFSDEVARAFSGVEAGGQLLESALTTVGQRAAKILKVDLAQASSAVTKEFREQLDALEQFIGALPEFERDGVKSATAVRLALEGMINAAKNRADLEALRDRIEALGKAGLISQVQVEALMKSLKERADEVTKAIDGTGKAADKAGQAIKGAADSGADALGKLRREAEAAERAAEELRKKTAQYFNELEAIQRRNGLLVGDQNPFTAAGRAARNASFPTQQPLQSDFRGPGGSVRTGAGFYTPPPGDPNDYEWRVTRERPGGFWQLKPEASQRVVNQDRERLGLPALDPRTGLPLPAPTAPSAGAPAPAPGRAASFTPVQPLAPATLSQAPVLGVYRIDLSFNGARPLPMFTNELAIAESAVRGLREAFERAGGV